MEKCRPNSGKEETCKPKNLLKQEEKKLHSKHHSEVFRSTPNRIFSNNFNSESKSSIENKGRRMHNISSNSNLMQKILKKNSGQQQMNSFFFSNQFSNYDVGFMQNILCFKDDDDSNSVRSEPIIIQNKCGTSTNMFSKLLMGKEEKEVSTNLNLNSSFPGAKNQNRRIKRICVKPINNYKKTYTRSTHKSLESFETGNFSLYKKIKKEHFTVNKRFKGSNEIRGNNSQSSLSYNKI